jgi:hypothetical protein
MASTQEIWNLTWLSWWEWDGFFYWPEWSVRIADNIDLQKVEAGIRIANEKIDWSNPYNWDLISVNPYEPFCFNTMNWSTSEIYYNKLKVLEMSSWLSTAHRKLASWGKMTILSDNVTYSYWITFTNSWVWKVHRFDPNFTWVSYSIGWDWTLWAWRVNNATYDKMPVLSLPWKIIWAWGNSIFQITNSETITRLLVLPKDADIMWITYYQDEYKIYYNWANKWWQTDSYIAYWDWLSEFVNAFVEYENSPVRMVANDWPYDYVVFWDTFSTDLYYVGWLNRWSPIVVNTEVDYNNNQRIFWFDWLVREWVLYFTGENKLWNSVIYVMWKYYPWSSTKLSSIMGIESLNDIKINANTQWLEIYDNNKIYTQSYFTSTKSWPTGTIFTYPLTWNFWIDTVKSIKEINIAYQLTNNADSIQLYVRNDRDYTAYNNTGWILVKTITWSLYRNKRWCRVARAELSALWLWNFYMLEYKIVLNRWFYSSPILYWVRTLYDDNLL